MNYTTYKITPTMSQDKIQSYLSKGFSKIVFTKGTYVVKKPYLLYSNTDIQLESGVILKRMAQCYVFQSSIGKNVIGYNGCHDINIVGLNTKIICDGCKLPSNIVSIIHSRNINIEGIVFSRNVGNHAIEINSSRQIVINKCKFLKTAQVKNCEFREQIQVDSAFKTAMPYYSDAKSKCYDGTPSRDITIKNCTIEGCNVFFGTHTQLSNGNKHSNILIENNTMIGTGVEGKYGAFCRIIGMDDVTIKNNTVSNVGRLVEITTPNKFYNVDSSTSNEPSSKIHGCKNIRIENNTMLDLCNVFQYNGVYIKSTFHSIKHENIVMKNNKMNGAVSNVTELGDV